MSELGQLGASVGQSGGRVQYRVTYTSPQVEEWWTSENAARECARERVAEGYSNVRIWTREIPEWRPVAQTEFPGGPTNVRT